MPNRVDSTEDSYDVGLYVAFVDILGFASFVDQIHEDEGGRVNTIGLMETLPVELEEGESWQLDRTTFFSDSIVMSSGSVSKLFVHARALSALFLARGFAVRGGIATGGLYHSNRVVLGKAMTEAYRLESGVARFPRIVLSEGLVLPDSSSEEHLLRDSDGLRYLKPFPSLGSRTLPRIRETVESGLRAAEQSTDSGLISKWGWLAMRFNEQVAALSDGEFPPVLRRFAGGLQ